MQIQVHFQGLDHSPWMDEFITNRVEKLSRYLNPSATAHVSLKEEGIFTITIISIHNMNHDYSFAGKGENVFESVSTAIDKANRGLSENKRKFKDRLAKRSSLLRQYAA